MSVDEFYVLTSEDAERLALHGPITNGATQEASADESRILVETWAQFERSATEHVPTLIDGLWPEHAFGFVAAPPKKGKTWIGLSLAISVAAGVPAFGHFTVPTARPVIYLALEGHKAAIRGRIGCLARGMGLNPDRGNDLDNLHVIYKPRGLNLADPEWVNLLQQGVQTVKPALIIVDVLRAAATIKESSNDEFSALRRTLEPLSDAGISIALLHHFGKLTEITKERSAGERMSGAGAMYGALDAGIFITGSDEGARKLRVEFELRDLATPEPIGLHLTGSPQGVNGGFVYTDAASWAIEEAPDEADVTANAAALIEWLEQQPGRSATTSEIIYGLTTSERTVTRRRQSWIAAGVIWTPRKGNAEATYALPFVPPPVPPPSSRHAPLAAQETLDMQAETVESVPPRHMPPNALGGTAKTRDLQDNLVPPHAASPTESEPAAGATAPLTGLNGYTDADIEALGVDLDQPAGTLDESEAA